MTTRHDLTVRQGADWSFVYTHLSGGSAVDLSGYSARMSVKAGFGEASQIYLSTGSDAQGGTIALGGSAGTVTLSMTAGQTDAALDDLSLLFAVPRVPIEPEVVYLYDLELVDGSGVVTVPLSGRFIIKRSVTR